MSNIFNSIKKSSKENSRMNNSVENRKAILEVNGISPDGYVSLSLNGLLVKLDAQGNKIEENKEIVGGQIQNPKLYRRWVMAQWFRQYNSREGYAKAVTNIRIAEQWNMISDELHTLAKLESKDSAYFAERTQFFNIEVISRILAEYVAQLHNTIEHKKTQKCKGIPYITLSGENIFYTDLSKKVYDPLESAIAEFRNTENYFQAAREFDKIKAKWLSKCRVDRKTITPIFKDVYKGAGAYYTLQNMVMYHNCGLTERANGDSLSTRYGMDAYNYMKSLLFSGTVENYHWTGMLRQCIKDNNFTFKTA